MYTVISYIIYLALSIVTVFVVGKNLHQNGKLYLFAECPDKEISTSSNNFLYTCYCLLNTAFALFFLGRGSDLNSFKDVLEFISYSQGVIFFSLGVLHVLNVLIAPHVMYYLLKKRLLTNKK